MATISDPELMWDLLFAHCDVGQGISFKQEIIVATIDVPSDLFLPILCQSFRIYDMYQFNSAVTLVPGLQLLLTDILPAPSLHTTLQIFPAEWAAIGTKGTG